MSSENTESAGPQAAPEFDPLTGLRTLPALRAAAEGHLQPGCALLICDLNDFRRTNELLGHLAGDELLRKSAQLLQFMTRGQDTPARIGGDEFAVFLQRVPSQAQLDSIAGRIESRFESYSEGVPAQDRLSITTAAALYNEGDTFQTMLDRAAALLAERCAAHTDTSRPHGSPAGWERDVDHIRAELTEEITTKGAFCRDFESFKSIYRFLARYKYRGDLDVCVMLLSLTEPDETTIPLEEKDAMMCRLDETLRSCLRLGDTYTRYSSSQFLVLAIDAAPQHGDLIADRIREKFLDSGTGKTLLIHHCYALTGIDLSGELPL